MEQGEAAAKPPAKKRWKLFGILGVVVVAGGVGSALYAQSAGLIELPILQASTVDPNRPQLVPRDDVRPASFAVKGERPVHPGDFKLSYHPLGDSFTANLKDSGVFVQVALGVSTYYDERVPENLGRHEMAIRSAVLMRLADQDPAALSTPQGKAALKSGLAQAINDVLKAREGFGGIDEVHFTGFVMQ